MSKVQAQIWVMATFRFAGLAVLEGWEEDILLVRALRFETVLTSLAVAAAIEDELGWAVVVRF